MSAVRLIRGDCLTALAQLADDGLMVDSVVTDPPYHLVSIVDRMGKADAAPIQSGATGVYARSSAGFMGQTWDGGDVAFRSATWRAIAAVMKPGAHLIAFSATRTYHRMVCAIEDAGLEIRDMVPWLYGTGFPKSHNLDGDWDGWGTALKPAIEPVVLARKPLIGSVAENMIRHGTGGIHIDACRVPIPGDEAFDGGGQSRNGVRPDTHHEGWQRPWMQDPEAVAAHQARLRANIENARQLGRWPANIVHDGSDDVLDAFAAFGQRGAQSPVTLRKSDKFGNIYGDFPGTNGDDGRTFRGDSGSAARFFYSAKATDAERVYRCRECGIHQLGKPACGHADLASHPTVKPIELMRWYVRMVTPPGGLVLDPFAGTGTTGAAAVAEDTSALLIERSPDYVADICVRLGITAEAAEATAVAPFAAKPVDAGPLFGGAAA
jgi:site-specific DNA-methyltransferase (adenine-specific)